MTSVSYAFEILIGYAIFGLVFLLMGGIIDAMAPISLSGDVYDFAIYMWRGAVVVYLIFGAVYFWRQIRTWQIMR